MEDFNNFTSFNGGNNENELSPQMASKLKKQSPSKSFMNPTISSSAHKTTFPKKKILAEQNQTLETNLDPKAENFPVVESNLQPYDPIKNYLSPRPKFLRYNPDRRRKIIGFQENENGLLDSGVTSFGLELSQDSCGSTDSCSRKESLEEAMDMIEKKDSCSQESVEEEAMDVIEKKGEEEEEVDDDDGDGEMEDEMVEFGEEKGCGFKGVLKFLVVVIALVSTTRAICSMDSNSRPRLSHAREFVWGFNDWYGKSWNYVSGVQGFGFLGGPFQNHTFNMPENGPAPEGVGGLNLNFSKVGDPIRESGVEAEIQVLDQDFDQDFVIEKEEEKLVEVVEIDNIEAEIEVFDQDFVIEEEEEKLVEVVETDNVEAEIVAVLDQDFVIEEKEEKLVEVVETDNVEAAIVEVLDQDFVIEEEEQFDANSKHTQLTIDDMEDGNEEIDEQETTGFLIGFAGFGLIAAVLLGVLVLIFGVIRRSNMAKTKPSSPIVSNEKNNNLVAKNQDFKNPEPAPPVANSASLVENPTPKNNVSRDVSSGVQAPTVELLGEFVFEVTNSSLRSNDTKVAESRQSATVSSSGQTRSSHIEPPTGSSVANTAEKNVKKPRRRNVEVTPSPVRRSTRIQNRPAAMMSP